MALYREFDHARIVKSLAAGVHACDFIGGEQVEGFEREWGAYLHSRAVSVANGTDALRLALQAIGVNERTTVCVPALTFGATAGAVRQLGATVRFSDIDPVTYTMVNPPNADVYIPVALFGEPVTLDRPGIIDGAQAHGAPLSGRIAWSHYPSKPLGCFGDGGSVSGDEEFVERVRLLANHGMKEKYKYAEVGWNSRLDSLQARVLREQLQTLDARNAARRANAHKLIDWCSTADVVLPNRSDDAVYHLFVVRHHDPDGCIKKLAGWGIEAARYYATPLNRTDAYYDGTTFFPVANDVCRTMFAVPCFAGMTDAEVERVADALCSL